MIDSSSFASVRILDLSRSYCGRLTTMALADIGCDVVRLSDSTDTPQFTDRGKLLCNRDAVDEAQALALIASADVVVEDLPLDQLMALDNSPTTNDRGQIHCWLPAFASDDPLAPVQGVEHTVSAASGIHDKPLGRRPTMTHLSILSVSAAAYALNGILGALIARERDGHGQSVRLVRSDVAYAVLELSALLTQSPPKSWATLQWAASPWIGAYRCADGRFIYVHAGLRKHLIRLLDAIDELAPNQTNTLRQCMSAQTLRDPTSVPTVREHRQIRTQLDRVLSQHPAWFWEEKLSERGLCVVEVLDADRWFKHEHATKTQHVIQWDNQSVPGPIFEAWSGDEVCSFDARPAQNLTAPALVQRWASAPTRPALAAQENQAPPLDGITVLDLTQVIAGPTAGRTLAEMGATVHRIENPHFDAPWVEAFHVAYQSGKTQQTLDLKREEDMATFWSVVDGLNPDVILHNLRPNAADAMGIGEDAFRARREDVIYVDMSAYGPRGPWGDRPGWEQTAQAVTGSQWDYGQCPEKAPELFPLPLNDLATGLFGAYAVLTALYSRGRDTSWTRVYSSLTRTATWMQGFAQCVSPVRVSGSNSLGPSAFHRYYKAYDGWMFLHVQPGQEKSLLRIIGLEHIPAYMDDRLRVRALERAFLEASVDEWIRRMRAGGAHDRVTLVPWRSQKMMFKQPRARAIGLIHRREHVGIGALTETSSALSLSRTPTVSPLSVAPLRDGQAQHAATIGQTASWVRQQTVGVLSLIWKR